MAEIRDKDLLLPLNRLLEANDKLAAALNSTAGQWPYVSNCWIDQLSEPTVQLAKHRINGKNKGSDRDGPEAEDEGQDETAS